MTLFNKFFLGLLAEILVLSCKPTTDFIDRIPAVEKSQFIKHAADWKNLRYGEITVVRTVWIGGVRKSLKNLCRGLLISPKLSNIVSFIKENKNTKHEKFLSSIIDVQFDCTVYDAMYRHKNSTR